MDSKLCRVCLDRAGTISVFDKQDGIKYSDMIMKCVAVRIEKSDGLPDTICGTCAHDIKVAYELTQRCEASDKALRCLSLIQTNPDPDFSLHDRSYKVEIKLETPTHELGQFDGFLEPHYSDCEFQHDIDMKIETLNEIKSEVRQFKQKSKKSRNHKSKMKSKPLRNKKIRGYRGPVQCPMCGIMLTCYSAYMTHLRSHTKEKPFMCDLCKKNFRNKYSLKLHIKGHYRENDDRNKKAHSGRTNMSSILCVVCGLKLRSRSALDLHMRTHTGEKPFSCEVCGKTFTLKGSLKRHMISHGLELYPHRLYICEHCGKRFYSKGNIIVHMRVHTGDKPYHCEYCSGTFRQLSSFIRHKRKHTGVCPYKCTICDKSFTDKSMLTRHTTVHSNERKFSCTICSKTYKTKQALNVHFANHGNTTRYVCNFCGSTFNIKGNLSLHVKRKHSEKSGLCTVCNKHFSDLDIHIRVHNGEKPFVCKICEQGYTTRNGLSYHMNFRHRDASKFKCTTDQCNKSFPKMSMLEFHVLKQHLDSTPYICQHCDRSFLRPSDLSRHLKVNHLDNYTQVKSQFIKTIKLND